MTPPPSIATIRQPRKAHAAPQRMRSRSVSATSIVSTASSVGPNRLVSDGGVSYAYDALGRRVSTTNADGMIRHVYDDNWQCIADIDEQGNVVAAYVWGEGIDKLLAVKIGDETYYPLTDIQGTVWGYADAGNNVVARWTYDAWGNVLDEDCTVPALATLRYRFQGRERSPATGLVHFRMRWYDTETGRWLSKDPIGISGGLNLYAFCGNEPDDYTDPFGLSQSNYRYRIKIGLPLPGIIGHITVDISTPCGTQTYGLTGWPGSVGECIPATIILGLGGTLPGHWENNAWNIGRIPHPWHDITEQQANDLIDSFEYLSERDYPYNFYRQNSFSSPLGIISYVLENGSLRSIPPSIRPGRRFHRW